MKHLFCLITMLSVVLSAAGVVTPRCGVRLYDEEDGLSQRSVKQIAVDRDGLIWIATWNGLNRFDGYDFAVIRPAPGDSARRYSSRFRDIKPAADGRLWCRIDDRLVRLDPQTNRFEDIHTALEERLGLRVSVKSWRQNTGGDTLVLRTADGWIIVPDNAPADGVKRVSSEPAMRYSSSSNRKIGDFGPYTYARQAYGREDADGHVWVVTRDGIVAFAQDRDSAPVVVADLGVEDGSLQFCTSDPQGGLWFRSTLGAHRLSPGVLPYTPLPGGNDGRMLASVRDARGRIWMSEPDRLAVAVHDPSLTSSPLYLTPSGQLSERFAAWGHAVYSLAVSPDGTVWAGTKPDGLWRLTPKAADRYDITPVCPGNIYDILVCSDDRLCIATLGEGVKTVTSLHSDRPRVAPLPGYPADAPGCRRLFMAPDSTIYAATTGGLVEIPATGEPVRLHVTEAGRLSSLGCIAVTDAVTTPEGLFVSTESDGVNRMTAPGEFASYNDNGSNRLDVATALTSMPSGRLLATGPSHLYTLDPTAPAGDPQIYGEGFWGRRMRFTDMRPMRLDDGRWLLGTTDGGIAVDLTPSEQTDTACRVIFTSASIQGGRDTLLTASTSALVLGKDERSLTLRFAAPEYAWPGELRYSVRIDGGEWSVPSDSRSITLYDLAPGSYDIDVTVTDHIGRPSAYARRLTLTVTPRWHETLWARTIFITLLLLAVAGAVWTYLYIKAIKRKQHETLEAYLRLAERQASAPADTPAPEPQAPAAVSEADNEFMQRVMEYVNANLADSEADVDHMAAAIGMSRSSLTRKMRSLMGVSPADFMRQTRLTRAATMLRDTDMPVKEIAYECGFADLNYFGKCFKATHGMTPTGYRKES